MATLCRPRARHRVCLGWGLHLAYRSCWWTPEHRTQCLVSVLTNVSLRCERTRKWITVGTDHRYPAWPSASRRQHEHRESKPRCSSVAPGPLHHAGLVAVRTVARRRQSRIGCADGVGRGAADASGALSRRRRHPAALEPERALSAGGHAHQRLSRLADTDVDLRKVDRSPYASGRRLLECRQPLLAGGAARREHLLHGALRARTAHDPGALHPRGRHRCLFGHLPEHRASRPGRRADPRHGLGSERQPTGDHLRGGARR
mmetsp:Transcript_37147/g.93252  ORF Transcript_37147/g.93252 Transcript_37147/m.93252 type:complete len:260 (-) Transcript_37147:400-1179(-)